jgi:DnaJ-class molecular chaperone
MTERRKDLNQLAHRIIRGSTEKEPLRVQNCPDCDGNGFSRRPGADPSDECERCHGKGWVPARAHP